MVKYIQLYVLYDYRTQISSVMGFVKNKKFKLKENQSKLSEKVLYSNIPIY